MLLEDLINFLSNSSFNVSPKSGLDYELIIDSAERWVACQEAARGRIFLELNGHLLNVHRRNPDKSVNYFEPVKITLRVEDKHWKVHEVTTGKENLLVIYRERDE